MLSLNHFTHQVLFHCYRLELFLRWLESSESVARTKFPSRTLSVTESTRGLTHTHKKTQSLMSVHCSNSCGHLKSVSEYAHLPGSSKYMETGRPVDSANTNIPWRRDEDKSVGGSPLMCKSMHNPSKDFPPSLDIFPIHSLLTNPPILLPFYPYLCLPSHP